MQAGKTKKRKSISYDKYGYLFVAPFFITFIIFQLYPIFFTFRTSLTDASGWSKVLENTTIVNYPKKEAEMYYDNYLASYTNAAAQYGMTLESMASMYGMTLDAFQNSLAQQAIAQVNQDMAVFALAEKENLVPDEARIDEIKQEMMVYYGYEDEATMIASVGEDAVEQSAVYDMVMEFIENNAVEVE